MYYHPKDEPAVNRIINKLLTYGMAYHEEPGVSPGVLWVACHELEMKIGLHRPRREDKIRGKRTLHYYRRT